VLVTRDKIFEQIDDLEANGELGDRSVAQEIAGNSKE
jgi:hypothetical protein